LFGFGGGAGFSDIGADVDVVILDLREDVDFVLLSGLFLY
jgi:hypothetical protein